AGLQEWPCGRRGLWWFYLHNSFINYNITVAACQLFCAYVNIHGDFSWKTEIRVPGVVVNSRVHFFDLQWERKLLFLNEKQDNYDNKRTVV
ncbi:hypothetical protein, partial [Sutterella seckii]|uniref:hypothetical protein n=1 Tax=Sutterella seckii TaxID=1944635 RepID=UPI001D041382